MLTCPDLDLELSSNHPLLVRAGRLKRRNGSQLEKPLEEQNRISERQRSMRCDAHVVHQDRIGVGGDALPKISDDKTVIVGGCYAASTITHFVRLDFGQSIYYLVCPINVAREQPSWALALYGLRDHDALRIARPPLPSAAVNRTQRPKRAPGSVLSQEKEKIRRRGEHAHTPARRCS